MLGLVSLGWRCIRRPERQGGAGEQWSEVTFTPVSDVDFELLLRLIGLVAHGRPSNIDRILVGSLPSNNGMLSYKDHGMLLCEIHVLRQSARRVMPGNIFAEFLEEINELVDLHTGVERQIRVVDRIRWAYHQWMN